MSNELIKSDVTLDVKGLGCPIPVLKTKLAFKKMEPGQVLEVISTDPGSRKDLPAWADKTGNELLSAREDGDGIYHYFLRKPDGKVAPQAAEQPAVAPPVEKRRKMMLICSKGTLDWAYPPLILATTAATMDVDVSLFFTFYGLDIINRHKNRRLKVSPLANPAMPMSVPSLVGALPGMTALATSMMKGMMKKNSVEDVGAMIRNAKELGVKFLACQMSMDVMGMKKEDLIDEVDDTVGAAAYVAQALDANISLFI